MQCKKEKRKRKKIKEIMKLYIKLLEILSVPRSRYIFYVGVDELISISRKSFDYNERPFPIWIKLAFWMHLTDNLF